QMSVQIEKDFSLCGLSIRPAVTALTIIQIVASFLLGIAYRLFLTDLGAIISIVMGIHIFCGLLATVFLLFVTLGRKLGTMYEVILHAHLLGILLMGLTSLFCVMYLPLSFLQQTHSLGEGLHWATLSLGAGGMFALQFVQKNANEQMLTHIEHSFI
ncbi:hypothetical protein PMAYCL1PPCAC_14074, partial [Pristionchus mayeri]